MLRPTVSNQLYDSELSTTFTPGQPCSLTLRLRVAFTFGDSHPVDGDTLQSAEFLAPWSGIASAGLRDGVQRDIRDGFRRICEERFTRGKIVPCFHGDPSRPFFWGPYAEAGGGTITIPVIAQRLVMERVDNGTHHLMVHVYRINPAVQNAGFRSYQSGNAIHIVDTDVFGESHVCAHELGHYLGASHVNEFSQACEEAGDGNADVCYGGDPSQSSDLMGTGLRMAPWHFMAWRRSMWRHLGEAAGPCRALGLKFKTVHRAGNLSMTETELWQFDHLADFPAALRRRARRAVPGFVGLPRFLVPQAH